MKLEIFRTDKTAISTIGSMSVDGVFECFTLENPEVENPSLGHSHICIPCGTYPVTMYDSPKHGRVPLLHDVPNRTWVEIHVGCFSKDTLGCILTGQHKAVDFISNSALALEALIRKIEAALSAGETVEITIQEAA